MPELWKTHMILGCCWHDALGAYCQPAFNASLMHLQQLWQDKRLLICGPARQGQASYLATSNDVEVEKCLIQRNTCHQVCDLKCQRQCSAGESASACCRQGSRPGACLLQHAPLVAHPGPALLHLDLHPFLQRARQAGKQPDGRTSAHRHTPGRGLVSTRYCSAS